MPTAQSPIKVIIGLGNPGAQYENTRHNVGWWVVDRLLQQWGFGRFHKQGAAMAARGRLDGQDVLLLKPLTYMNKSGVALLPLLRDETFNPATDLLVVVDDTALPVGRLRFRPSGSAGGHNGLKSIEQALRSREYPRLRLGVGEKPAGEDLADWVLSEMPVEDEKTVYELLPTTVEAAELWLKEGTLAAMNKFNR